MLLYHSRSYSRIIEKVVGNADVWQKLKGKVLYITGATGLIGSGLCDVLLYANEKYNLGLKIYAAVRNIECARARFNGCYSPRSLEFCCYDATSGSNELLEADFYIHAASPATPDQMTENPVGVNKANVIGLIEILDFIKKNRLNSRVVYISSSEVYGIRSRNEEDRPWAENELGIINHLSPRASYSSSKRAAENICVSFFEQYGIDSVVVRPGHIYGPTAKRDDIRASSDFAHLAAAGQDIIMHSEGGQLRSYMHVIDAAMAILYCAIQGKSGEVYNISNPNSIISIRKMAEILCMVGGSKLKIVLPSDENKKNDNPMLNSSLDSSKLYELGYRAVIDYEEGLINTVEVLKNI